MRPYLANYDFEDAEYGRSEERRRDDGGCGPVRGFVNPFAFFTSRGRTV